MTPQAHPSRRRANTNQASAPILWGDASDYLAEAKGPHDMAILQLLDAFVLDMDALCEPRLRQPLSICPERCTQTRTKPLDSSPATVANAVPAC